MNAPSTGQDLVTLDLIDFAGGKVALASFHSKVEETDFSVYSGRRVQLSGCAPTWAHLMVAAKLMPHVSSLSFLLDDGKSGQTIPLI